MRRYVGLERGVLLGMGKHVKPEPRVFKSLLAAPNAVECFYEGCRRTAGKVLTREISRVPLVGDE